MNAKAKHSRKNTNSLSLLAEDVISFREAQKEIPTRPCLQTIYRWCERGVDGIKLERVRIGGRFVTSRQAVHRFLAATQS